MSDEFDDRLRKQLAGFLQHGVHFDLFGDQCRGACPFCGKEQKFFVNPKTKCWDCKVCGSSGNFTTFLSMCMEMYQDHFHGGPCVRLSKHRGLSIKALRSIGIGWSPKSNWYAIPVYDAEGHVVDIQRYTLEDKVGRSTTGRDFGCIKPTKSPQSSRVWVCEGAWDTAALHDVFTQLDMQEMIYGLPGANNFHQKLGHLFNGKHVVLCLDHDTAGEQGSERFHRLFGTVAKKLEFVQWPMSVKVGYDIRDLYTDCSLSGKKVWSALQPMIGSRVPGVTGSDADGSADGTQPIGQVNAEQPEGEGLPHEEVCSSYRKWLHLPDTEPLYVLFGAVLANRFDGDPLWIFLVAPPGGAKSELIMPLADAPMVYTTTSLTPHSLVSGASFGQGDPSLIPRLNGKVLAIKDFTTILSMNQLARDEVFGVLRDAYDGKTCKEFGNGVIRRYESRFGIIAGVTPVIDAFGAGSVLGERFLKYRIPDSQVSISSSHATVMRALSNVTKETEMRTVLSTVATQALTRKITIDDRPELPDGMLERIAGLAHWVAQLRAIVAREKYTGYVTFKPSPEVPTRLSKQMLKLGIGISAFKREAVMSEETYQIIVKVARDTAPDRVEMVVRTLYLHRDSGFMSTKDVADQVRFPQGTVLYLLQDLDLLGIASKKPGSMGGQWRLSARLMDLMEQLKLYVREEHWARGRAAAKRHTCAKKGIK